MSNTLKITPRGEITWQVHDTADGRLYLPPTHDETLNPMEIFDQVDDDRDYLNIIGHGTEGVVYDIADYAVKTFRDPYDTKNISMLRVNVALTEGLRRIAQPQNSSFEIAGAEIYGAFIPHPEAEEKLGYCAIWLMEKINPPMKVTQYKRRREHLVGRKLNKLHPLPTPRQRRATYNLALEQFGFKSTDIVNDENECNNTNLLIEKIPEGRTRGRLIKIDERPVLESSGTFTSY